MRRIPWFLFVFLAITIGAYPVIYFITDMSGQGFLSGKEPVLLESSFWQTAFYGHIIFGGLSLLFGWPQFSGKIRQRNIRFHRFIGLIYLSCVTISGICAVYLAIHASGGIVAKAGFFSLGILWLFTTWTAYASLGSHKYIAHGKWMIRSYALSFAAVMLRIYMPLFLGGFHLPFDTAYPIISWLCWVPNLIFAEWIIHRRYRVTMV